MKQVKRSSYSSHLEYVYDAAINQKVFVGVNYFDQDQVHIAIDNLNELRKELKLPPRHNWIKEGQYDAEVMDKLQKTYFDELDTNAFGLSNIISGMSLLWWKMSLNRTDAFDGEENVSMMGDEEEYVG